MRTKVLILIDSLSVYGAERVAADLAGALRHSARVKIVTYKGDAGRNATFVPPGVGHIHIRSGSRGLRRFVLTAQKLLLLIRAERPNVILSFMPYANALGTLCCVLSGTPNVVTEHNVMSLAHYGGRERPLLHFAMRRYLRLAPAIVAVSQAVADDLVDAFGAPRAKVVVIYNPIDVEKIIDLARVRPEQLPGPTESSDVHLVIVGGLRVAKGHDCALRALSLLPQRFKLYLVGDGPLRGELERLSRSLGVAERVSFVGEQQNAVAWLAFADVVLVPSRWEGFGLVAAEARVLGRTVIATAAPGLLEVAQLLGCEIVPPDDPVTLANAIREVDCVDSVRSDMPRALSRLSPAEVARRYLAVLEGRAVKGFSRADWFISS